MAAYYTQLNDWLAPLWRYFEMAFTAAPITKTAVLNWVQSTFAAGIGFTSLSFFLFFPLCVLFYHAMPRQIKNTWLLLCSYVFYYFCTISRGKAHPEFLGLLAGCTLITWLLCLAMDRVRAPAARRAFAALAIVVDLGLLVWYKYLDFFAGALHQLLPKVFTASGAATGLILPIGISFYIFLSVGYTIDVYRGTTNAERNLIDYALFVSFFPQIVSGPIARSTGLLAQLKITNNRYDHLLVNEGLRQMLWGYFKKMVIAGNAAAIADTVFASPVRFNGFELLCGSLFYTLQIYADFSGYTDIATGAAKVLGLRLGPNFNRPYFSRSIGEFWDRWHISLSSWLQTYLYIPLGGSRKSIVRTCINFMLVFLLSGLWHGAAYTYLVWGALHGAYSVLSRCTRTPRKNICTLTHINRIPLLYPLLQWAVTFSFISFAWIFFRATSLASALVFISRLPVDLVHTLSSGSKMLTSLTYIGFFKNNGIALLGCTLVLFLVEAICAKNPPEVLAGRLWLVVRMVLVYLLVLSILLFGVFGASGWVYGAY